MINKSDFKNKIYCNYRPAYFNHGEGSYSPSTVIGQQFSDYEGLIEIKDNQISEQNYTYKNANGKQNLTRFMTYSYIDGVDYDGLVKNIRDIASFNNIEIFESVEEAKAWIIERTDLEEVEEGKFLVREANNIEEGNETPADEAPAEYLTID